MRVKSMANKSYTAKRVYVKPQDKLPWAKPKFDSRMFGEGVNCCNCGWPIKATSSATRAGEDAEGNKKYAHGMCPSLSERRRLRAEALEQG